MANPASAVEAGGAFVRIWADDSQVAKALAGAQAKLKAFAASVQTMGRELLTFGLAAAAPLLIGSKVFMDFDRAMSLVATMLDEPERHMSRFRKGVREMSQEFGKSAVDMTLGLYDIVSAQVPAEKAMGLLRAATVLAAAGNAEVSDSVKVMLTLMDTYGDSFKDAGDAADFLFAVVKRGRTTLAKLAPQLGRVIAVGKSAGLSLEDLGASMALLTRATGETEQAVVAMTAITSTLLKRSDAEASVLRNKYGMAFNYTTLQAEGLTAVLQKLATMKTPDVTAIFPDLRAIRGLMPGLAKMANLEEDVAAMTNRAGAATKGLATVAASVAFSFDQARQTVVDAFREIGAAIAGPLAEGMAVVKDYAKWIGRLIKEHQDLVVWVAKAVAGIVVFGGTLLLLGKTLAGLALAVKALTVGLVLLGRSLSFLVTHPFLAYLAAFGAVMALAANRTAQLADKMQKLREAGDAARAKDSMRLQQLKLLAEKEQLTNEEMERAEELLKELSGRYGDLGASINRATRELTGFAEAQGRVRQRMQEAEMAQLKAEWFEIHANIQAIQREMQDIGGMAVGWREFWGGWLGVMEDGDERLARLREQAELLADQGKVIQARWKAIGEEVAGEAGGGPAPIPAPTAGIDAAESVADFNRRTMEDLHRLRLQMIQDEEKRAIAAVKHEYQKRIDEARKLGASIQAVERARDVAVAQEQQKFARQRQEEETRKAEQRADIEEGLTHDIARLGIEQTKKGLGKEMALLELEYQRALKEALDQGIDVALIEQKFKLLREAAETDWAARLKPVTEAQGTFNPFAVRGLAVGNPVQEMATTLKQMKQTQDRLVEIDQKLLAEWKKGLLVA
jgi:TP901 family phage tail tape measure protein